ncbi:hypothetical protein GTA08_BOTSDO10404 [Botryosphaeria dothidea]|uniref:DUF7730 domain-containing protein n=1 Tax=Botryosphaeria dothidea TaxID=55169 RepID=A0A8H4IJN2_9PEZI|nr:hypothetical protein GTA08_BOTSDO10404 [Botryosphaeria dothidea]
MAEPTDDSSTFVHIVSLEYLPPEEPFPLLNLPRELRDIVYGYMMIRKRITVTVGYCWADKAKGNKKRFDLRVRERRRTAYQRTLAAGEQYASYEEMKYGRRKAWNYPNLNIFLTNRQIYDEASAVYYGKNTFEFPAAGRTNKVLSVQACHAFLQDRPPRSLGRIKSLELIIDNPSYGRECAAWLDGDVLVPLVEFIRDELDLDRLSLIIEGWPPEMRSSPWDWMGKCNFNSDKPRKWVGALARLNNLKSLSLTFEAHPEGDPQRIVACARFLRSQMLNNGALLGSRNIHAYERHCSTQWRQINWKACDVFTRERQRIYVVQCHDDEHGNSLLPPKAHPEPRLPGIKALRVQKGHDPFEVERAIRNAYQGRIYVDLPSIRIFCDEHDDEGREDDDEDSSSDYLDYDLGDDGDDDSLLSFALEEDDSVYVRDDEYFDKFEEHEQTGKPCTTG